MLVLFLDLLDHALYFHSFPIIDTEIVLVLLQGSAHAIQSLWNLAALVSDQALREKALCASVIIAA